MNKHKHNWVYYDGCLGYESMVCSICGIDINELKEKLLTDCTSKDILTAKVNTSNVLNQLPLHSYTNKRKCKNE